MIHNDHPDEPSLKTRLDFLWKVHDYTGDYVRHADAKAGVCTTWSAALLGVLLTGNKHKLFVNTRLSLGAIDWKVTLCASLSLCAFVLLASAFLCAVLCVLPRLYRLAPRTVTWEQRNAKRFVYWEDILGFGSEEAFAKGIGEQSTAALLEHLAKHVFTLSDIACRKYWWVDLSICFAVIGSALAVIVVLL